MNNVNLHETVQTWAMWARRWVIKNGQREIGVHLDPGRVQPIFHHDITMESHGDYTVRLNNQFELRILIDPFTRMGGRPESITLTDRGGTIHKDICLKSWSGYELDELIPRHEEEDEEG